MSTEDFVLTAQIREDVGKAVCRRLRRQALVPAIVYGGEEPPKNITIESKELIKQSENEAFYSHIISLSIAGNSENVILKDIQRHPAKAQVLHVDFLRISEDQKFTTKVPLHFINEDICKGVKIQGGMISRSVADLEISCLPANLPEYIEVDLAHVELGQIVHISDLTLPSGVASVALSHGADYDLPVASINKPKGSDDDDLESAGEDETESESE